MIALDGSHMRKINANNLMERVKKVYIERVVRSGFEDGGLYNDELLKLDAVDVDDFNRIGKAIGRTKAQKGTTEIDVNKQGLTDEEYKKAEEAKKKPKKDRTPEDEAAIAEQKKRQEMRQNAISVLRSISIRMPLLIYGAEIDDEKEEITIDNFENLIDTASWDEFMPTCEYDEIGTDGKKRKIKRPLSKAEFRRFKKYYDPDIFIAAAKRIRQMVRNADEMPVEQRIARIADIFSTFRNPDKETVLTPWRVVNMHMSDTLGGYTFFNEGFTETIEEPRFIDRGNVTAEVFNTETHLLEINSKTGLYPLLLTYNTYRARLRNEWTSPQTVEEYQAIWDAAVRDNVFVICKTKMAKSITRRTLLGFREGKANMWAPDDLINKIKNQPELFIKKVYDLVGKNVKINAIVGNPPYQDMGGSGGSNDAPIYQEFGMIASKVNPRYVSLVIPSRWFAVGRDNLIGEFRSHMLNCGHVQRLVTYNNSRELFPNVEIKGGICYYLENSNYEGDCLYTLINGEEKLSDRLMLNQFEVFIRDPRVARIVAKASATDEENLSFMISADTPFGIPTNPSDSKKTAIVVVDEIDSLHPIRLYYLKNLQRVTGYISAESVTKNSKDISKYKVFVPKSGGTGNDPKVLGEPIVVDKDTVCSQTFLYIPFEDKESASNFAQYLRSRFLRFLVSSVKITQDALSKVYRFVPLQDFTSNSDIDWSQSVADIDRQLYAKYGMTSDEVSFIESMIKPM